MCRRREGRFKRDVAKADEKDEKELQLSGVLVPVLPNIVVLVQTGLEFLVQVGKKNAADGVQRLGQHLGSFCRCFVWYVW